MIPLAFALRLALVGASLALARHPGWCRRVAFLGSMVASALTGFAALRVLLGGASPGGVLLVHPASGVALGYAVPALSAWFLLLLAGLAIPAAFYSVGYLPHAIPDRRTAFVAVGFNVLLAAVEGVFVADSVLAFLFAWELMTLATAVLVATDHERREHRRAAFVFLVMSHVGTGCLVAGFFLLSSLAGSTAFSAMLGGTVAGGPLRDVLFVLFFVGFGVKAGAVPLHVWLPEAHPVAPSNVSALMSGVLIKTGLYGLLRVCVFGLGTPRWGWGVTFVVVGSFSGLLGVLYALAQKDLKRLLAYSTIENGGLVVLGMGAAMMALSAGQPEVAALAVGASLFHALNHALFKGLLFLGAGSVVMATGTRDMEAMGGLGRRMPWTSAFFLVGAAAISGLPLLNGFASEWLLFQALLTGFQATESIGRLIYPAAGALLALTSALAAACFVKAFSATFLALPRSEAAADAHESPATMLLPLGALAVACVSIGLAPGLAWSAAARVAASLPGTAAPAPASWTVMTSALDRLAPGGIGAAVLLGLLLTGGLSALSRFRERRVPSWGCGGVLDARTEYTATAFSKPLLMIFDAIYRPTREVQTSGDRYFPSGVTYRSEIEATFERYVYEPLTRAVMDGAERLKVIQAGSLHAYLAYVLLLGLALLLWLGGSR